MSTINRQPAGWLGFLGIKNFGRNPETTSGVLAPTWDLSELYLNSSPQYLDVTTTAAATGYTVGFAPPAGEIWYVMDGGVFVFSGAGLSWSGHISRSSPNNAVIIPLSELYSVTGVGRTQAVLNRPLILAPGENLGWSTAAVAGGASNVYAAIRYARLLT